MSLKSGQWAARIRVWLGRGRGESVVLAGARVLCSMGGLAVAIASARQLGPAARGEIVIVMTVAMIVNEFVSLGADVTGKIKILRQRDEDVGNLLGLIIVLTGLQAVVGGGLLIGIERVFGTIRLSLVPLGILLGVSMFQGHMLTSACFAIRRSHAVAFKDGLIYGAPLVPVFVLAVTHRLSVDNVVVLLAIGYLVGDIYLWKVVVRHSGPACFRPRSWIELLRSSVPVGVTNLSQTVAFRVDRMIMGLSVSATGLGIFSVAATAAEAPRLLIIPTTQILANRIATDEVDRSMYVALARRIVGLYGLFLLGLAVVLPRLVVPIVGVGFAEARGAIIVLLLAEFLLGVHFVMAAVLLGVARFGSLPVPALVGAMVVVVGGLAAVSDGGLIGVAWVRVGAFGAMALLSSGLVIRNLNQPN